MERSIPQGRTRNGQPADLTEPTERLAGLGPLAVGAVTTVAILVVYLISNPQRTDAYNHFVWQASAWLEGQASIRFPVAATASSPGNDYFQDVLPLLDAAGRETGRALLPFPPLPAVVLLPFVAILGLATPAQLIASILGGVDVAVAWWMLGRLPIRLATRLAVTVFFGLGTVFWYAAKLGSTWYLAHVVAVGLTLAAIGVAVGPGSSDRTGERGRPWRLEGRIVVAGLLIGLAAAARLPVLLAAPFLALAGPRQNWLGRAVSAAVGAAPPVLSLVAYNYVSTGHPLNPVYDYLYQLEALGYPELGYHPEWAIEDVRYIPGHLGLMLAGLPQILPACPAGVGRALFDAQCPFAVPDPVGMGLLFTSPAYLLAIPALLRPSNRIVIAGLVAAVPIALLDLAHFSQGWVQFGYRFSLDFAPFLLPAVALGVERLRAHRWAVVALIGASIIVNAWGVAWGGVLGW